MSKITYTTGPTSDEAKKMLWQTHSLRWRHETSVSMLRDGVCYAYVGFDTQVRNGEEITIANFSRDFEKVWEDLDKAEWTAIQTYGGALVFDYVFNQLGRTSFIAQRKTTDHRVEKVLNISAAAAKTTEEKVNNILEWKVKKEDTDLTIPENPYA
jgi:hypothetical protein